MIIHKPYLVISATLYVHNQKEGRNKDKGKFANLSTVCHVYLNVWTNTGVLTPMKGSSP